VLHSVAAFVRRVVAERLGIVPDEIAAGHCVALSRPVELADRLEEAGRRRRLRLRLRLIDHYDDELRRHNDRLRAAAAVRPGDRVLDIGCGAGQSTRDAARVAGPGSALGVDVSEELLERARRRTAEEGQGNATYELGDAQIHPFLRPASMSSSADSAPCSSPIRPPRSPIWHAQRGRTRAW
jgi:SAM-dependent methyltransferase